MHKILSYSERLTRLSHQDGSDDTRTQYTYTTGKHFPNAYCYTSICKLELVKTPTCKKYVTIVVVTCHYIHTAGQARTLFDMNCGMVAACTGVILLYPSDSIASRVAMLSAGCRLPQAPATAFVPMAQDGSWPMAIVMVYNLFGAAHLGANLTRLFNGN